MDRSVCDENECVSCRVGGIPSPHGRQPVPRVCQWGVMRMNVDAVKLWGDEWGRGTHLTCDAGYYSMEKSSSEIHRWIYRYSPKCVLWFNLIIYSFEVVIIPYDYPEAPGRIHGHVSINMVSMPIYFFLLFPHYLSLSSYSFMRWRWWRMRVCVIMMVCQSGSHWWMSMNSFSQWRKKEVLLRLGNFFS